MALLMQWLSESDEIPLVEGSYSFHQLALQWMGELWESAEAADAAADAAASHGAVSPEQRWALTRKFMDYLEAGGEAFWQVPELELTGQSLQDESEPVEEADDDEGGLFGAAYENVTYRDTTDDGFDGEIFEQKDAATDFELASEAERISKRLAFLRMLARLWRLAAARSLAGAIENRDEVLGNWLARAEVNRRGLEKLLDAVHRYPIPAPSATDALLTEYDRCQGIKEMLLERVMIVSIETSDAARLMTATTPAQELGKKARAWETPARTVFQAIHAGSPAAVRKAWPKLTAALLREPLLYLPMSRGGSPKRIVASRTLQHALAELLVCLPRLGMLRQTCELIETIHRMERNHPVGQGAITEFDKMFETGFRAIIQCIIASAAPDADHGEIARGKLIECIEEISEPLVRLWIGHSRNIRFSPLEAVSDERQWLEFKQFIQDYGHDLFTQTFMTFGNLRAILHQGVDEYLAWLADKPNAEDEFRLIADLDHQLPRDKAIAFLGIAIEAVLDKLQRVHGLQQARRRSRIAARCFTRCWNFLRLTASYDRVAWHLEPLVLVHEVLVRQRRLDAAELWRDTLRPANKLDGRRTPCEAGKTCRPIRHETAERGRPARRTLRSAPWRSVGCGR